MADDPDVTFQISPATKDALDLEVKAFPGKLKDELRKQLSAEGDQIISAMRAKLLQAPPTSGAPTRRSHSSRQQAAAGLGYVLTDKPDAVELDLRISTDRLPQVHHGFPWFYDKPSWIHPVFGRQPGVAQQGRPFIENTVKNQQQAVQDSVTKALDNASETVKGSRT